jgi:hypothetical protein
MLFVMLTLNFPYGSTAPTDADFSLIKLKLWDEYWSSYPYSIESAPKQVLQKILVVDPSTRLCMTDVHDDWFQSADVATYMKSQRLS